MQTSVFSIAILASLLPMAMAACGAGEIGVVARWAPQYTGGVASLTLHSGSIIGNDCSIKASNGLTQNHNQWCRGGYSNGYSVDCQGGSSPVTVRDGNGALYRCKSTTHTDCNRVGFNLGVCCLRS